MDKKRTGFVKPIKEFIQRLKKEYSPSLIMLFGSRARGENLVESDYDILVVSSKFRGKGWIRRHEEVYSLWNEGFHLDILCYSPEEFEVKRNQIGVVKNALEEGILLS
jgi:hypothetical protein